MSGWVELIWDGKRERRITKESVDKYFGRVREVKKIPLPFQKIELLGIDKRRSTLERWIPFFPEEDWPKNYPKNWKNLLIWGDNKLAMSSLLQCVRINDETINMRGKIKLIYIDPPFATGADFSFKVPIPKSWRDIISKNEIVKNPSIIEELAYRDMWGGKTSEERIASYLNYMYDRLVLMKELLANDGFILVHLDYRMVHYMKLMMDEIFGKENFRNEIVWAYRTGGASLKLFFLILYLLNSSSYSSNPISTSLSRYFLLIFIPVSFRISYNEIHWEEKSSLKSLRAPLHCGNTSSNICIFLILLVNIFISYPPPPL